MPSLMNTAAPDPVLALHLLRSWMQSQADAGVPRVAMTNEARAALKHIIRTKPWKRAAGAGSGIRPCGVCFDLTS